MIWPFSYSILNLLKKGMGNCKTHKLLPTVSNFTITFYVKQKSIFFFHLVTKKFHTKRNIWIKGMWFRSVVRNKKSALYTVKAKYR